MEPLMVSPELLGIWETPVGGFFFFLMSGEQVEEQAYVSYWSYNVCFLFVYTKGTGLQPNLNVQESLFSCLICPFIFD